MNAESAQDLLPKYLHKYLVEQSIDSYSARDHAAWRYIMRQSRAFFQEHALPVYLEGLEKTGITIDRIPLIKDMDKKLRKIGWAAVPVRGFIPPAAFLDFQARRILPIAADMRTVEHIHYTPAPDIVHEAAGHAPILADEKYSEYLTKYANLAQKAIFAKEDLDLYEAIRTLSDVKENPDSTRTLIEYAQKRLDAAVAAVHFVSEANKTARMNWWTVEYGLIGDIKSPKIYGAGLLSSVGESQNCLGPKVKKIPLTVECVETSYDITEPQPQLFVADSIEHLIDVLGEFEKSMAFVRGGTYGLDQAVSGRTVTTSVLDTGIEISGILESYKAQGSDIEFVKWTGPTQLAADGQQLAGHGPEFHCHGFSSPIGRWKEFPDRSPGTITSGDLARIGIQKGKQKTLELANGFVVRGLVADTTFRNGKLIVIKWQDCTVKRGDEVFFQPDWGDFDMAIGESVTSVFGGPADRDAFGSHDVGNATTTPTRQTPYSFEEKLNFSLYQDVCSYRIAANRKESIGSRSLSELATRVTKATDNDWLLRIEFLEGLEHHRTYDESPDLEKIRLDVLADLDRIKGSSDETVSWLVGQGQNLLSQEISH